MKLIQLHFVKVFRTIVVRELKFKDILVHPYDALRINNEKWMEGIEAHDIFLFKKNLKARNWYLGAYIDCSRNYFDKGQSFRGCPFYKYLNILKTNKKKYDPFISKS